jgi:hypothetical protein
MHCLQKVMLAVVAVGQGLASSGFRMNNAKVESWLELCQMLMWSLLSRTWPSVRSGDCGVWRHYCQLIDSPKIRHTRAMRRLVILRCSDERESGGRVRVRWRFRRGQAPRKTAAKLLRITRIPNKSEKLPRTFGQVPISSGSKIASHRCSLDWASLFYSTIEYGQTEHTLQSNCTVDILLRSLLDSDRLKP